MSNNAPPTGPTAAPAIASKDAEPQPFLESGLLEMFDEPEEYPDGGRDAWLVVFGAWCAMIPSMGLLNTIGVLQAWVWQHQLAEYTEFDIGWIFGLYGFFLYFTGAQVGK